VKTNVDLRTGSQRPETACKKPYSRPRLRVYGTIEKITGHNTLVGVSGDNGMAKNNGRTGG
jgi:hypothetical protein